MDCCCAGLWHFKEVNESSFFTLDSCHKESRKGPEFCKLGGSFLISLFGWLVAGVSPQNGL